MLLSPEATWSFLGEILPSITPGLFHRHLVCLSDHLIPSCVWAHALCGDKASLLQVQINYIFAERILCKMLCIDENFWQNTQKRAFLRVYPKTIHTLISKNKFPSPCSQSFWGRIDFYTSLFSNSKSLKAACNHISFLSPQQLLCEVGSSERVLRRLTSTRSLSRLHMKECAFFLLLWPE